MGDKGIKADGENGRREEMSLIDAEELYKTNPRVKDYVDKYMRTHGLIDLESALQCMVVKNFIEYAVGGSK